MAGAFLGQVGTGSSTASLPVTPRPSRALLLHPGCGPTRDKINSESDLDLRTGKILARCIYTQDILVQEKHFHVLKLYEL